MRIPMTLILVVALSGCGHSQIDYTPSQRPGMSPHQAASIVEQGFYEDYSQQKPQSAMVTDEFVALSNGSITRGLKGKQGRRLNDYFRDFIGCQEGIDGPSETRTLLEDLGNESAREKTTNLVNYSLAQAKIGEPITLDELSELLDENRPKAFYDFIRNKDYGLPPEIPADKRTLNQFRRFTGRTDGLSISFEAHLLGSKIKFDKEAGTLILRSLPTKLIDQLKRAS